MMNEVNALKGIGRNGTNLSTFRKQSVGWIH